MTPDQNEGEAHTPGPWTLDARLDFMDGTDMEVLDARHFPIATVEASPILNRWEERFPDMGHWAQGAKDGLTQIHREQAMLLANARLIAASPELLEELEALVEIIRGDCGVEPCEGSMAPAEHHLARALAAIAKARATGR